jgi:hypothetical protein
LGSSPSGSLIAVLVGGIAFDVDWPSDVPALVVAFALATVASFSLGLVIAAVVPSARVASGVGSIIYFPMLFFAACGPLEPRCRTPPAASLTSHPSAPPRRRWPMPGPEPGRRYFTWPF